MLLESEGDIKVSLATSGKLALELSRVQHFDVMLFDLHMPDINGLELTKHVLGKCPDINLHGIRI